jgi:hypothetical protein
LKKKDIKVGKRYIDKHNNSVREVVDEGPHCKLISGQTEEDCVRYQLIAKKRGPYLVGSFHNTTRTSFARWAKREWRGK